MTSQKNIGKRLPKRCRPVKKVFYIPLIISSGADITIVEPEWLRIRLIELANKAILNNSSPTE